MKPNELSTEALLFAFSNVLKQMDQLYAEKKELEKEIASRNESLKQRFQDGKIKLEREEEE
jgi:hypothetical protein